MRNAPYFALGATILIGSAFATPNYVTDKKPAGENFTCLQAAECTKVARMSLHEAMQKVDVDSQPNHRVCNVILGRRTIGHVGLGQYAIPTAGDPIRGHCGTSVSQTITPSHIPVVPIADQKGACQNEQQATDHAEQQAKSLIEKKVDPEALHDALSAAFDAREKLNQCLGRVPQPQSPRPYRSSGAA